MEGTHRENPEDDSMVPSRARAMKQMPRLPKPRPRDLTPFGYRDGRTDPPNSPKAFFQHCAYYKSPPEIRRCILRLAFGDRRMHMDLSYHYTDDTPPEGNQFANHRHCGIPGRASIYEIKIPDENSRLWRWWGCICHRLPPDFDTARTGPMTYGGPDGIWVDNCDIGEAKHCASWPGSTPYKCHVGIIGWLLSCRQNYAEAIDVLYSTNTIIMTSEAMICSLPRLILPVRLATITSLEISWDLKTRQKGQRPEGLDESDLDVVLKTLSVSFPSLRRLYLSFRKSRHFRISCTPDLQIVQTAMNTRLDDFAHNMTSLREFAVSLPPWLFECLFQDTPPEDSPLGHGYSKSYHQVWRSLDGKMDFIHLPYVDSYPEPPHHLTPLDTKHKGYWLLNGTRKPEETGPALDSLVTDQMYAFSMSVYNEFGFDVVGADSWVDLADIESVAWIYSDLEDYYVAAESTW
ncbi:hypothetical protein FSARC_491 [Fusarium sarcochroum]|uniref:DUF7730 domain-containing protein n=1 Tax=Fusarium sarcochroum TaxID=1208366 RepID=A0A8H4UB54_9HYPO|nr:hypothetical protein FSARC_491 [Fusarium sarcochroum]